MSRSVHLGDHGLAFAREELATAADDFGGPLAQRLADAALDPPFSLVTPRARTQLRDLRRGGVDDGTADKCLAVAISRWLCRGPAETTRMLVLEDPLARRSDPVAADALFFGERVYFAGAQGDAPATIERVLGRLAGYPGIGVLSQLARGRPAGAELTEETLNSLAAAAAAVLVRAWDDEAFVVVPVEGRLGSHDLGC